jgi:hypothetical protein
MEGGQEGELPKRGTGKGRRGKAPSAARRRRAKRVKIQVHISAEARLRLVVHSEMEGRSMGETIEELILSGLNRYVVSDRQAGQGPSCEGSQ